ncbi:putative soluble adenylyl cyclase [Operophtera brumata]|uniref:Putative soluble adenylyl cyclase n=1 Tax=Operophtera brumata TaxID=104452 RepID=A0A0L7LPA1_OPEBR|nr:putative soluble adenylyl cyclase [Operophtera brumata]
MRALYPRWMLLRANSLKLSGRQTAATALFNQFQWVAQLDSGPKIIVADHIARNLKSASDESRRINNQLEESLIRAATSKSVFWTQSARANSFTNWQAGAEHARCSWYHIMYRITTTRQ